MMKIDKVIWNMVGETYCVAKVGHSLMNGKTNKDNPLVTSIVWAAEEDGSIFINFDNKDQLQIIHPDEVHYVPSK